VRLEDRPEVAHVRSRRPLVSLTPLIDVVFILLVFFMLASSFSSEQIIDMLVPVDSSTNAESRAGAALVRINRDGGLDLNGETLSRTELAQRVAAWSVSEQPRRYLVQPGRGVSVQQIVTVVDLLKSSGAGSVSLTRQ
jgi:biopolymer transport protein ExbD